MKTGPKVGSEFIFDWLTFIYWFLERLRLKLWIHFSEAAAYKFGCSKKKDVQKVGCTVKSLMSTCYCTGNLCDPGNPTDKNDVANKTKPKTNSANTIGAQVTIGFAVFLAVFNKVMAWIYLIML